MREPTRSGRGVCHSTEWMFAYHSGALSGSAAYAPTSRSGRRITTLVETSTPMPPSLPPAAARLAGKRRERLQIRAQVLEIARLPARPAPRVREVEMNRNPVLGRHRDGAAEVRVRVVPAEDDVLPDDLDAAADGLVVDAREVRERGVEASADPVAPVGLLVAAVNGEDQPVEQALADDGVLDRPAHLHAVGRDRNRGPRHDAAHVAQRLDEMPIQERLAVVEEID